MSIDINLYPARTLQNKRAHKICIAITLLATLCALATLMHITKPLQQRAHLLQQQASALIQAIQSIKISASNITTANPQKQSSSPPRQLDHYLIWLKKIESAFISGIVINKILINSQQLLIQAQTVNIHLIQQFNKKLSAQLIDIQEKTNGQPYQFTLTFKI